MGRAKENAKLVVIALAVMLAVPLGYRVWFHCHPQPEGPSLATLVKDANDARREALLVTPLGDWSEADAKLAPDVHAWLKEHDAVVLPWEWSAEAKRKDPKGYRALWRQILGAEVEKIDRIASRLPVEAVEPIKALEGELSAVIGAFEPAEESSPVAEAEVSRARGCLYRSILAVYPNRELLKRRLPAWLPEKVRKWLGRP